MFVDTLVERAATGDVFAITMLGVQTVALLIALLLQYLKMTN